MDMFNKYKFPVKEAETFEQVPKIFVYKKGEYYPFDSYFMPGLFMSFINRVLNPTIHLQNVSDIENFLDVAHEYIEQTEFFKHKFEGIDEYYSRMGKRTRVIAFFTDKKEYNNEFKLYKRAA